HDGTHLRRADASWFRPDFGDGGFALIDQNATDTTNVTMYHTYFNVLDADPNQSLLGLARVTKTACASDDGNTSQWVFRGFDGGNPTIGCEGVPLGKDNGINTGNADTNVLFYAPMALGPGNPQTLYFGTDRLYRSVDRGDSTTVVSQAPIRSGVAISAIGISPQNDNVRIVGLVDGTVLATTT